MRAVRKLSQAFALAVPHEDALRIRDDVAFFQSVAAGSAARPAAGPERWGAAHQVAQLTTGLL